jgi:hypothetical protein
MAEINLTKDEADVLMAMEKHRVNDERHVFPFASGSLTIPLQSPDKREQFLLDISLGRIDLLRGKYQNRARQVVILVRLDFGGAPHRNPDGGEVLCPHLHLYQDGYGDKWAIPAPSDIFTKTADRWQTLQDFMQYCHVTKAPYIERGLFL